MTSGPPGLPVDTGVDAGLAVSLRRLRHVYQLDGAPVVALDDVDLVVPARTSLAVLGPSGSGKSTLLAAVAGLLRPSSGQVLVGADDVATLNQRELMAFRAARIGVVLQEPGRNVLPYASAEENVRFAQRAASAGRRGRLRRPAELLGELGLSPLAGRPVVRLSGGEQQRLAVALALANSPGLLLADEPTSQLDRANRDAVVATLRRVSERFGTTVLAVTHDAEVSDALDATLTLAQGRPVRPGRHSCEGADAVVRADGALELPAAARAALGHPAPGTRLRITPTPHGLDVRREPG